MFKRIKRCFMAFYWALIIASLILYRLYPPTMTKKQSEEEEQKAMEQAQKGGQGYNSIQSSIMRPLTAKADGDANRTKESDQDDGNNNKTSVEVTMIVILVTNIIILSYPVVACIYSKLIYDAPCMSQERPRPPPEEDADNERLNILRLSQFIQNQSQ